MTHSLTAEGVHIFAPVLDYCLYNCDFNCDNIEVVGELETPNRYASGTTTSAYSPLAVDEICLAPCLRLTAAPILINNSGPALGTPLEATASAEEL